jgi:hypothetical protein
MARNVFYLILEAVLTATVICVYGAFCFRCREKTIRYCI